MYKWLSLVLAFLIGCGVYSFWILLQHVGPPKSLDQYCQLSTKICVQHQVAMRLNHDVVTPLQQSYIQVNWPQAASETLRLSLRGVEQDLGVVEVTLINKGELGYVGSFMLPVCTGEGITWKGILTDGSRQIYPAIRMENE